MSGPWIAEARFVVRHRDGTRAPVRIAIGAPQEVDDREWTCALSLQGLYDDLQPMSGGDALQALGLAWGLVRTLLTGLEASGDVLEFADGGVVPLSAYFGDIPAP